MYWCAIFLGIGFLFCFFFMEETNYDRAPLEMVSAPIYTPETTPEEGTSIATADPEKDGTARVLNPIQGAGIGKVPYRDRKSVV